MIEERLVAPTWVARWNRTAAPACLKAQSGLHFCAFGATVQPCRATNAGATRLDSRASVPRRPERGQFVHCWRGCLVLSRHYEWRDCSALSRLLKWCDNCALLRQRASTPRKVCKACRATQAGATRAEQKQQSSSSLDTSSSSLNTSELNQAN